MRLKKHAILARDHNWEIQFNVNLARKLLLGYANQVCCGNNL